MSTKPAPSRVRRVSRPVYKLLLTTHVIVSVGWLGVVLAKLLLGIAALTSGDGAAMRAATSVLNLAFPPVAIATVVSGVLLCLGTRWGLLRYYWTVTKLVLTVGVIGTAVGFGEPPLTMLVALAVTHLLMLVVATVVSVYKPWGRTRIGTPKPAAIRTGLAVH